MSSSVTVVVVVVVFITAAAVVVVAVAVAAVVVVVVVVVVFNIVSVDVKPYDTVKNHFTYLHGASMFESLLGLVDKVFDCGDAFGLVEGEFASPKPSSTIPPKLLLHETNRSLRVMDATTTDSVEFKGTSSLSSS